MRLLKIVFGCYAFVIFLCSLLIVFPCYYLVFKLSAESKAPARAHAISRSWAQFLFTFYLVRYKIKNKHLIDPDKTYVFVANHRSMLDIPLFARSCTNTFRFLSKAELAKIPLLGYVIKKLYITVDRDNSRDRSRSIDTMRKTIEENISVFLCPEGTRNTSDKPLLPFKDGAFRLAIATQTPVAVLTIFDSDKFLPPYSIALSPGAIHAVWSEPIETKGMTEGDVDALKRKAATVMTELLENRN